MAKMRILSLLMLVNIALFQAREVHAWGEYGHVTVCEIAYRNLTDNAREKLNSLLAVDQEYTAFNRSCLEEDERPRPNPKDHFVNYPRDTKEITGPSCPGGGNCITAAIERDTKTLADTSAPPRKRADALLALGHWVGDIHQPLHVSFKDDRGGNTIKKRGKCSVDNLHAVWDTCIIEKRIFKTHTWRAFFGWAQFTRAYRAADRLIEKTSPAEIEEWIDSEPWQWAAESFAITLNPNVGYCVKVGEECWYAENSREFKSGETEERVFQVTNEYLDDFEPVVELRLRQAGYRLAALINRALDPPG